MQRFLFIAVFVFSLFSCVNTWSAVTASPTTSTTGSFTINWPSNGSTNYTVTERKDGGSTTNVYFGSLTHKSLSGRSSGSYVYNVIGDYCDFICYPIFMGNVTVTVSLIVAPSTPGSFSVPSTTSNGSYTVSWAAPSGTVTSYTLKERYNGGIWSSVALSSSTSRSKSFSKSQNRYYDYKVEACNQSSCSAYTASKRVTIPAASLTASISPTTLNFTTDDYTLTWSSVMVSNCSWTDGAISGKSGSKKFTASGLTYVAYYKKYIKPATISCNVYNGGTVSKPFTISANKIPPKPTVSVWWNKTNALVGEKVTLSWGTSDTSSCTLDNVSVGVNSSKPYTYTTSGSKSKTVTCSNAQGSTSHSSSISLTYTKPNVPSAISGSSTTTNGQYNLTWGTSSSTLTSYTYQERFNSGGWKIIPRTTSFTKTNPGTYDYRLRACNHEVCSAYSASKRVTISAASVMATISPTTLNFTTDDYTLTWSSVMVSNCSWTDGAISGKSGSKTFTASGLTYVANYNKYIKPATISCDAYSGGTVTKPFTISANKVPPKPTVSVKWNKTNALVGEQVTFSWDTSDTSSCTLDNVSVGVNSSKPYTYTTSGSKSKTVTCSNAQGSTSHSSSISLTYTKPNVPGVISGPSTTTNGQYNLTWGTSSSTLTSYTYQERFNSGSWNTIPRTTSFNNTNPGTYDYRIRACNHEVCSAYSASKRVTISAASVTATISPTTLNFTTDNYTLTWSSVMVSNCSWTDGAISGKSGSKTFTASGLTYVANYNKYIKPATISCDAYSGATITKPFTISANKVPPKPTVSVKWNKTNALVGEQVTFSWETSDTSSCTLDNVSVGVNSSKPYTYTTSGSKSKTVTCSNAQGSTSHSSSISLTYTKPNVPGTISGPSTTTNGQYNLTWGTSSSTLTSYTYQERFNNGGWSTIPRTTSFTKTNPGTYDYQIRACNHEVCSAYSASKRVTVPVASLSAGSPSSIITNAIPLTNGEFSLTWSSVMTSSCLWDGGALPGVSGTTQLQLSTNWQYKTDPFTHYQNSFQVKCNVIGGGTISRTVPLMAWEEPPKPSVNVYWEKSSALVGETVVLHWDTDHTTSCKLGNEAVVVNSSRPFTFETDGSLAKTVTCTNLEGSTTDSATISVSYPPLPTVDLNWGATSANIGDSTLLRWETSGADTCSFEGDASVALNNSILVPHNIHGEVKKTLTCTNVTGSVEDSSTIVVLPDNSGFPIAVDPADDLNAGETFMGYLNGSFNVGASGNASYSIPIEVPPGIRGMQPGLSIGYNSAGRNGVLGWGWSLSAQSRIHRCAANHVRDGYVSGTRDGDDYKLCLDGQRLVETAPGEYRTERESYRKITKNADNSFTVKLRNGRTLEYGSTEDARRDSADNLDYVDAYLSRVSDIVGNYMTYHYEKDSDNGIHRIQRIEYTKNIDASSAEGINQSVVFKYESRDDVISGFRSGTYYQIDKRMDYLDVLADGDLVRRYNFSYQASDANNNADPSKTSRLKNVNVCYDEFSTMCSDPIVIDWTSRAQADFGFTASTLVNGLDENVAYVLGDFDADGVKEVLVTSNDAGNYTIDAYLLEKGETYTGSVDQFKIRFDDILSVAYVVDVDYDGRDDLILIPGSYDDLLISYSTEAGFTEPVVFLENAQLRTDLHFNMRDFNRDGLVDMFRVPDHLKDGTTRFEVAVNLGGGQFDEFKEWGLQYGGQPKTLKLADMNGDGLTDIVRCDYIDVNSSDQALNKCRFIVSINNGSGFDDQTLWGNTEVASLSWSKRNNADASPPLKEQSMVLADVNSDGIADIVWAAKDNVKVALNNGAGFEPMSVWLDQDITPVQYAMYERPIFSVIDLNLDGNLDLVFRSGTEINVAYNRGAYRDQGVQLANGFSEPEDVNAGFGFISGMDVNNNGVTDISFLSAQIWSIKTAQLFGNLVAVNNLEKHLVTGIHSNAEQSIDISYLPLTNETVHTPKAGNSDDIGIYSQDYLVYENTVASASSNESASFTSHITRTRMVVNNVDVADGVGGIINANYHYTGQLRHRGGWGSLGFEKVQTDRTVNTTGERSRTVSEFSQQVGDNYNAAGLLLKSTAYASDSNGILQLLSTTVNQWQLQTLTDDLDAGVSVNSPHYRVHRIASHTTKNDLNGAAIGNSSSYVLSYNGTVATSCEASPEPSVTVTSSAHTAYDAYGNVHQTASLSCDGSQVFTSSNKQQYENKTSGDTLVLGLVTNTKTTATAPDANGTLQSLTREQSATYNDIGLPLTQTREPENSNLLRTTTLSEYDAYGTPSTVVESWNDTAGLGFGSRSSSVEVAYQTDGTRTITTTNALNQETVSVMNGRHGQLSSYTDINQLTTTSTFDALGRLDTITAPDFTTVVNRYRVCDGCEAQSNYARFYIHSKATGASSQRSYFDAFGRDVGQRVLGLTGEASFTEIGYNAAGRVEFASQPFFVGGDRYNTVYEYDSLGRVTHTTAPNLGLSVTQYNGLEITVTNALSQQRVQWQNGIGQNIRTQDNLGSEIEYSYDPFGNLEQTTVDGFDVAVDVITTMGYDLLGRQQYLDDPSAGRIDYTYNGLDLMVSSMDAENQKTEFTYDKLGRQKQRIDDATASNTSVRTHQWIYDTESSGEGRLDRVSGYDTDGLAYSETYQYNDYGLPAVSRTTIQGEVYETETYYDAFNRPIAIEYPTGYTVVNQYNDYGYRDQIIDALNGKALWEASTADAFGNITSSRQGNGVVTTRDHDQATGRVTSIHAMNASTLLMVQNQEFFYDELGNLQERTDQRSGVGYQQVFCYDGLNRLKASREGSCSESDEDVTYDSLGNIITRIMYGNISNTYTYDSSNPYKLATTTLGGSYGYDNNGNIISGDGRSITYSSFDKPTFMSQDGNTVGITYGPDQNRIKRIDNSAITTTYVSGIYEKREEEGVTSHVHYVGDIALHVWKEENNTISEIYTRYLHHDNLGSIVAKTNEDASASSAEFTEWMANDPWGFRQDEDWSGSILGNDYQPSDTRKGFTGHEHLDGVGLIHMNGRVYDPSIGRFLSADIQIEAPTNTQSFNRYAYVWNNPLSNTDPTGFDCGGDGSKSGADNKCVDEDRHAFKDGNSSTWSFSIASGDAEDTNMGNSDSGNKTDSTGGNGSGNGGSNTPSRGTSTAGNTPTTTPDTGGGGDGGPTFGAMPVGVSMAAGPGFGGGGFMDDLPVINDTSSYSSGNTSSNKWLRDAGYEGLRLLEASPVGHAAVGVGLGVSKAALFIAKVIPKGPLPTAAGAIDPVKIREIESLVRRGKTYFPLDAGAQLRAVAESFKSKIGVRLGQGKMDAARNVQRAGHGAIDKLDRFDVLTPAARQQLRDIVDSAF